MKEKRYKLPEDKGAAYVGEPTVAYHGNAAMTLPGEDVAVDKSEEEYFDWNRIPYMDSPTNEEEAIAQIQAIEEEDARTGASYTVNEFFQELQKARTWQ